MHVLHEHRAARPRGKTVLIIVNGPAESACQSCRIAGHKNLLSSFSSFSPDRGIPLPGTLNAAAQGADISPTYI
jgi:hypothetical protein